MTFGTNILKMSSKLLTVDSAPGLHLIDQKDIPNESVLCIKPTNDIMLHSATDHRFALTKIIKVYIFVRDAIFQYYFDVVEHISPKVLFVTSFIDKNTKMILPKKLFIYTSGSHKLQILTNNDRQVLKLGKHNHSNCMSALKTI